MSSRRAGRRLLLLALTALMAVCAVPAASALAAPLTVSIDSPVNGSAINDPTPLFTGTTGLTEEEPEEEPFRVSLKIRDASGQEVGEPTPAAVFLGGTWSIGPVGNLPPGLYTAQAELEPLGTKSETITFTVDTTPPQVTLTSPANGSSTSSSSEPVGGTAGTEPGDASGVTIQLFAGGAIGSEAPLETLGVGVSGGNWSATFGGLNPGTYTAQAAQRDQAGNTGTSSPVTFTVTDPSAPSPPAASFSWFPQAPKTGEGVSLVSSSTDSASAITAFAWALSSTGPFSAGKPVLTTSFATPGAHVVRLRVTDAAGRTSVATQTIPVTGRALALMQPFPIVRIAGSVTSRGAKVRLLSVQTPLAARVTVTCKGNGCKMKAESRIATTSRKNKGKGGSVTLSFHRFERSLRGGVQLQIRVSKTGEIGKFTSFAIRRNKLPLRVDACLPPASSKPITCPTS